MGVHKTFNRPEEGGSMGRGRIWRSSLRYCVVSLRFALAAIVCAWAVFLTQLDEILEMFRLGEAEAGAAVTFLENGFKGQTMLFLVPILCALPGAAVMTEETLSYSAHTKKPKSQK